ncbi:HAMP domain-containing sensor histidine kinase [Neolewinella lacunae]|uniref:histidine kinase n=1 Tax=Neolewinella lacunae TaxID=1517758 RepID=A0A923PM43_9BACT|nr:HAMP domain-containing sensor histidine kinase [Neolewinella lacunae]MBC6993799.1 HAMP domain-containing histidine kinase [Neolewinella lacunae]MDN3635310.1 HAMP domain-containing sensor histidine kinase [Neolewinella lacunae]
MRRLPLISYAIIAYMLLAFAWWSVLLLRKTKEAHVAQVNELAYRLAVQRQINAPADFRETEQYAQLTADFKRQQLMIMGEALLLVFSLAGGLFLLYRNLNKEISAAEQQRNFLLSITHELKSPLSGIRLILETFQKRRELQPEIQQKLSTNALAETDRLTALVNDLLLSAKLENVYYQINAEDIDLGGLIQDAVDQVAMKYKNANIHVDIEPDVGLVVGDRLGLTSVAVNLLENAAKYSQPEPVIHTSLQRGGSKELVWEVADNGMGIPDREKKRVFTKFYRVGNEDTRTTKGTGLGLFIVKELVTKHGGQLELLDNLPKGTRFRIYLPTK